MTVSPTARLALPAVNQIELHPLNTRPALRSYMAARSILPIAYSSLAPLATWRAAQIGPDGAVEGSAKSAELAAAMAGPASALPPMAARYEVTEAQLLLRWAVQQGWPVLPKSSKPERVRVAVGETVILLTPPLSLVGVSTGIESGRQQNDSLADG